MASGVAEYPRLSGGRVHEPEKHAHRRRLARPVGAEESEDAAPRYSQRQMVDRDNIAVSLREVGRLDHVPVLRGHADLLIAARVDGRASDERTRRNARSDVARASRSCLVIRCSA